MGSAFGLVVPADDETVATLRTYYESYLDRLAPYLDASSVEGLRDYRHAVDRLERDGRFMVSEKLLSDFPPVMEPLPSEIYRQYATDREVLSEKIGLAKLARSFERARDRLTEAGDLEEYHERRLDAYLALVDFAMEHGCGVSYP